MPYPLKKPRTFREGLASSEPIRRPNFAHHIPHACGVNSLSLGTHVGGQPRPHESQRIEEGNGSGSGQPAAHEGLQQSSLPIQWPAEHGDITEQVHNRDEVFLTHISIGMV